MKKTKIAFEDIKAGDLIEVSTVEYGVKNTHTGIAFDFEKDFGAPGMDAWKTVQDGILAVSNNDETIYRIDVTEVKFEDIRKGDLIKVTAKIGSIEKTIQGRVHNFLKSDAAWYEGWETEDGDLLLRRRQADAENVSIEILERGE